MENVRNIAARILEISVPTRFGRAEKWMEMNYDQQECYNHFEYIHSNYS